MAIDWGRARRRLAALEQRTRRLVEARLYWREIEDGCILLRAALREAGLDPEANETLRHYGRPDETGDRPQDTPEHRAADAAFAARDPVLSRRPGLVAKLRGRAAAIPRDCPAPRRETFSDCVAWAMVRLGIFGAAVPAPA
jgi:hypothetical protein